MAAPLTRAQRRAEIVKALAEQRQVEVGDLALCFGVTEMTIRRDLAALDQQGQATRIHGGARLPRPLPDESRANVNSKAKQAIAEAINAHIAPGETVGIDLGTTCRAVAQRLARRDDIVAITNSIHTAITFRYSASRLILLGGQMTNELNLVNGSVIDALKHIRLDTLILGCAGLSRETGLTYYDPAEVAVRKALIQVAERVIVAADHSKFRSRAGFTLGPITLATMIVTNSGLAPETLADLQQDTPIIVV